MNLLQLPTQKEFAIQCVLLKGFITRNYCLRNSITRVSSYITLIGNHLFNTEKVPTKTLWGNGVGYDYSYTLKENNYKTFYNDYKHLLNDEEKLISKSILNIIDETI